MAVALGQPAGILDALDKGLPALADRRGRAAFWPSSTTAPGDAGRRGSSRGSRCGQTARAPSRPDAAASSAAADRLRLRAARRLCAGRRGLTSPRLASISGQRGGGRRCADRPAPRGRACCRDAATPSPSAGGGPCVRPPAWRSFLERCHRGPESARGCADEGRSAPAAADPPASGPTVHSQRVTPVLTEPPSGKAAIWGCLAPKQGPKPSLSNWTRFSTSNACLHGHGLGKLPHPVGGSPIQGRRTR